MQAQGMWSAGDGDDNRRFLADLRGLRDTAALEFDELAARAHYPSDVLKEAENGPSLPTLPILAAYVRACGGDVPEWEERWRRLGSEAHADPGLPVRPAGASPAAVAGARAGGGVAPPESYDAERIRAVLRSAHGSSDRGARGTAGRKTAPAASAGAGWDTDTSADTVRGWGPDTGAGLDTGSPRGAGALLGTDTSWPGFQPDPGPHWDGAAADVPDVGPGWGNTGADGPDAGPGWDSTGVDLGGASANGNHHVSEPDDGPSDTAVIEPPDADRAEAIRRDPFSTAWLEDELTSSPDLEPGWQDQADAEPSPDDWFVPRETTDREQTWSSGDTQPSPAVADTWFTPLERNDDGPVAAERDAAPSADSTPLVTGFWTPSTAAQSPAPASAAAPGLAPAPAPAPAAAAAAAAPAPAPAAAEVRRPDPPQAEGLTMARTIAERAVPPGPVVPPSKPRADRSYLARLLMVMVVAALIGSVLVLLIR
ncbi:MAG TPA: helix-turn-helix transcriptional regulator [Streptosporangiaceae bacterium]|nr:helix-turn-helix transcriptional regulator [Streptosporangiaceae bacterium]